MSQNGQTHDVFTIRFAVHVDCSVSLLISELSWWNDSLKTAAKLLFIFLDHVSVNFLS